MTNKKKALPPTEDDGNEEECIAGLDGITGSTFPLEYIDAVQQDPWPKIVGSKGFVLSAEVAIQERELTLAFVDGSVAAIVIPSAGSTQH